jgi:hypothetical protein
LSTDADGDGHYALGSCLLPNDDCDDNDPSVYPGAPEVCDGLDNNCDGSIDEGLSTDADGDGHYAVGSCLSPADDCDDFNPAVFLGATEICDGLDNDCNGIVDDGLSTDADGDGHYAIGSCLLPNDDCDDNDPSVYPGAPEVCDGLDNNCNGLTDDEDPAVNGQTAYYADADGDGYGDESTLWYSCSQPMGYVTDNTDCDDTNATIYPGAEEILNNGIDEDCDGEDEVEDDGCTNTIAGNLNINPSFAWSNLFYMETPTCYISTYSLFFLGSNYTYEGNASLIKIKVKGSGKTLVLNGDTITLAPNIRYEFTGDMTVSLENTSNSNNSLKAMGKWWINIEGEDVCVSPFPSVNYSKDAMDEDVSFNFVSNFTDANAYPNPFIGNVNVSFTLNYEEEVELRFYNELGKQIKYLPYKVYSEGKHEIKLNSDQDFDELLPTGLYFIQLNTLSETKTLRVLHSK